MRKTVLPPIMTIRLTFLATSCLPVSSDMASAGEYRRSRMFVRKPCAQRRVSVDADVMRWEHAEGMGMEADVLGWEASAQRERA